MGVLLNCIGFVGWQKQFATDPKLTADYDADHWKEGYYQ